MQPPKNAKLVWASLSLVGYYWKFIKNFAQIKKPLRTLKHHNAKFNWTPDHQVVFISLKGALIWAPRQHYPDHLAQYIFYTNACGAQLSQEHNSQELPVMFLSHTFMETQWKWSTPKQEAYGFYYAMTK